MKTKTLIYRGPWVSWTIETVGAMWTTWKKSCSGLHNLECLSPQRRCAAYFNLAYCRKNLDYIIWIPQELSGLCNPDCIRTVWSVVCSTRNTFSKVFTSINDW